MVNQTNKPIVNVSIDFKFLKTYEPKVSLEAVSIEDFAKATTEELATFIVDSDGKAYRPKVDKSPNYYGVPTDLRVINFGNSIVRPSMPEKTYKYFDRKLNMYVEQAYYRDTKTADKYVFFSSVPVDALPNIYKNFHSLKVGNGVTIPIVHINYYDKSTFWKAIYSAPKHAYIYVQQYDEDMHSIVKQLITHGTDVSINMPGAKFNINAICNLYVNPLYQQFEPEQMYLIKPLRKAYETSMWSKVEDTLAELSTLFMINNKELEIDDVLVRRNVYSINNALTKTKSKRSVNPTQSWQQKYNPEGLQTAIDRIMPFLLAMYDDTQTIGVEHYTSDLHGNARAQSNYEKKDKKEYRRELLPHELTAHKALSFQEDDNNLMRDDAQIIVMYHYIVKLLEIVKKSEQAYKKFVKDSFETNQTIPSKEDFLLSCNNGLTLEEYNKMHEADILAWELAEEVKWSNDRKYKCKPHPYHYHTYLFLDDFLFTDNYELCTKCHNPIDRFTTRCPHCETPHIPDDFALGVQGESPENVYDSISDTLAGATNSIFNDEYTVGKTSDDHIDIVDKMIYKYTEEYVLHPTVTGAIEPKARECKPYNDLYKYKTKTKYMTPKEIDTICENEKALAKVKPIAEKDDKREAKADAKYLAQKQRELVEAYESGKYQEVIWSSLTISQAQNTPKTEQSKEYDYYYLHNLWYVAAYKNLVEIETKLFNTVQIKCKYKKLYFITE